MSSAAKLRKKAAEFEAAKQIDRAIAAYVEAIDQSESDGHDIDVALLNKVGDLAIRQGRVADAVTYYERAVEHYAGAGLFNNAIALCNKLLRSAPGRSNVYFTLGRICARKGLRSDATRNFLEYATRMQHDGRIDEGMRALAEVADLMPELTEVRRLVDEHAARAGITLPRRGTPVASSVLPDVASRAGLGDKSPHLVFLEVEYEARAARRTPSAGVTAASVTARGTPEQKPPARRAGLDDIMLFDPDTEGSGVDPEDDATFADTGPEAASAPASDAKGGNEQLGGVPGESVEVVPASPVRSDALDVVPTSPVQSDALDLVPASSVQSDALDVVPTSLVELDATNISADDPASRAEDAIPGSKAVDPVDGLVSSHDFGDAQVERLDGLTFDEFGGDDVAGTTDDGARLGASETHDEQGLTSSSAAAGDEPEPKVLSGIVREEFDRVDEVDLASGSEPVIAPAERAEEVAPAAFRLDPHMFILPGELPPLLLDDDLVDAGLLHAGIPALRTVSTTPSVPIAAVAAEANAVALSRRDSLRAAVAETPRDWMLRRRLAEALFEAGERDAALAELETALAGFLEFGELASAAELADEMVLVARDRVPYHQKRVELAVRLHDNHRLRDAYLDLADALLQQGDEGRARAVYARVLEIDPNDDRARAALGASAPPQAVVVPRPDDEAVGLADWLRDDEGPASTRMRMMEPAQTGDEQADFDVLLKHFKEGVAHSLGEEDYESHYDLGVAYKEMGLLDDAVAEFQKALRSRSHRLAAYEALGQCFVEQERYQVAATVLSRAMHEPGPSDDHRVGVLYLLAYSSEALQRWGEARSYYERVHATDTNFRDVAARLAALEQLAS